MKLTMDDAVAQVAALIRRSQAAGGVFTLLWHNSGVIEPPYTALYPRLLALFSSRARYDWSIDLRLRPLPRDMEASIATVP